MILAVFLSASGPAEDLRITCTTTLLSSAVKAIGKDRVKVHTIVPVGMCPGHFDISPAEVERIRNSDLMLAHGFERFLDDLLADSKGRIPIVRVSINANWMIPEVQAMAACKVTDILASKRPDMESFFRNNLTYYTNAIHQADMEISAKFSKFSNTPIVCSEMNTNFVQWFGFNIVATFPRDEDISVKTMSEIILKAKKKHVSVVIDNLQSSGKVGKTLAGELGVPLVMLSNFPGKDKGSSPYIHVFKENCARLLSAIGIDSQ